MTVHDVFHLFGYYGVTRSCFFWPPCIFSGKMWRNIPLLVWVFKYDHVPGLSRNWPSSQESRFIVVQAPPITVGTALMGVRQSLHSKLIIQDSKSSPDVFLLHLDHRLSDSLKPQIQPHSVYISHAACVRYFRARRGTRPASGHAEEIATAYAARPVLFSESRWG